MRPRDRYRDLALTPAPLRAACSSLGPLLPLNNKEVGSHSVKGGESLLRLILYLQSLERCLAHSGLSIDVISRKHE